MKNIIPVILISTSLLSGMNIAYAAKKTDPVSNVWEDSQSKEWGNTPESVKYVLSNVQISREQGGKSGNQTDLFSTKWLKEMQRSPSTYRLTEDDKKWVDNVLANAESKKSSTWKPSNKTPVVPAKQKEIKNIDVVKPIEVVKTKNTDSKAPTGTGLTKEAMFKDVNKVVKAESKPLPTPKIEVKEKPDLTPVPQKIQEAKLNEVKNNIKEIQESPKKEILDEDDIFLKSLPQITDEDLPQSEIEQTREEMSNIREINTEKRIDELLSKEENSSIESTKIPEVKIFENKDVVENKLPVLKESIKTTENIDSKAKESIDKNIIMENKVELNQPLDNKWIGSAISSLVTITILMFIIVMEFVRRMKKNGKLQKYI